MRKDISGSEQRRGTRTAMIWGAVAAAVLLVAVSLWPLLPGPETGTPPGQGAATSPSRTTGQFSNQTAGQSETGKSAARAPEDNTGARARDIQHSSGGLSLGDEQKAQLKTALGSSAKRTDTVDFTISIGAAVPRQVELGDMPAPASQALGGYEGSQYLLVRDQLVIVDRSARRVVAIVPGVG
jgi:hypothetical protein